MLKNKKISLNFSNLITFNIDLKANTTNNITYYYDCNNRLVKLINGIIVC